MNILNLVENREKNEFYPTPREIAERMLSGVDFKRIETILEPSAGKGNILEVLAEKENSEWHSFDVDCIEIDPNLRQILRYNFSDEKKDDILTKIAKIENNRTYNSELRRFDSYTKQQETELIKLKSEKLKTFKEEIHIVHDDFLTYSTLKHYDLIVMNPPFSNGDKHLLKALKMQEGGGSIICLLNSETIRNPCTASRKELVGLLDKYKANVEHISGAFKDSERKTDVDIVLIKVYIESEHDETSEIYNYFQKSMEIEDEQVEVDELEVTDFVKMMVNRYNVETRSGVELIRQYKKLKPYIMEEFSPNQYTKPLLELTGCKNENDYLKKTRLKYWEALLSNKKFTGKLTSELQNSYRKEISKLSGYDFSEFNIRFLSSKMNGQIKQGIEDEIIKMFDRLTAEHSWYPETQKNKHYYDGWATNKAHKIGKKVIIPCYGVFDSWDGKPRTYNAIDVLEDIEKVLNYLDGGMTSEVSLHSTLSTYFENSITKNVPLKYFTATFYKKGTVHLVFNCTELIDRFNIYAGQKKNWLPPCYGNTSYKNMTEEEKKVVDNFQGEKEYNKVMDRNEYYLAPVSGKNVLMIE